MTLVTVRAVHDLFSLIHFLYSIKYFEFNIFIYIYVQQENYILLDKA